MQTTAEIIVYEGGNEPNAPVKITEETISKKEFDMNLALQTGSSLVTMGLHSSHIKQPKDLHSTLADRSASPDKEKSQDEIRVVIPAVKPKTEFVVKGV